MTPEEKDARAEMYDTLSDLTAGLLGVEGSGQHMQPMAHHAEPETDTLWFVTSRNSDLVSAIGPDARAQFTISAARRNFWAATSGPISISDDAAKLDELWSSVSAAWFDEGRDDPDVCLLKMSLASASIWSTTGNPFLFGLEIARSNLTGDHKPDIGTHVVIDF